MTIQEVSILIFEIQVGRLSALTLFRHEAELVVGTDPTGTTAYELDETFNISACERGRWVLAECSERNG